LARPPAGSIEDADLSQYAGGEPEFALADTLEAGFGLRFDPVFELKAAAFAAHIDREMLFDHVSNTNIEMDGTSRRGLELSGVLRPLSWVRTGAELAWIDARFLRSGNPVPGTAAWTGSLDLAAGGPRGPHGHFGLEWSSARALAHGASTSAQARADLALGWRFARVDLTLVVDNLSDARTLDGAYHYASWFDTRRSRSAIPVIHYTAAAPRMARLVLTAYP
jgi:hypothetical protein